MHILLLIGGTLLVAIGIIGIFIPLLPTTPFLILAAACYVRSSERFYNWLIGHRILGRYLKNYWEGRGVAKRDKILALVLLWVTIGFSATVVVTDWWGKILLLIIAMGVTIHLIKLKTLREQDSVESNSEFHTESPESVSENEIVSDVSENA